MNKATDASSFRRTKIICTIGPASRSPETLTQLMRAGMDAARLNFSHGSHQEHAGHIKTIRQIAAGLGKPVAIIADLPGPKVRTGGLAHGHITLTEGETFTLTADNIEGTKHRVAVNLPSLPADLKPGNTVFLDDGAIKLQVMSISGNDVVCRIAVGGLLGEEKGVNVPDVSLSVPSITAADLEHLAFALEQGIDLVALSFIREASDVVRVREFMEQRGARVPIIAKIEKHEALGNIDKIVAAADGIMVARGDLGVEIPLERVPIAQKYIILRCKRQGKPAIVATQMLESMIASKRPTRAEVADIANAVFDGADAVMLSGETSIGKNPVEAAAMMALVARETEKALPYENYLWEARRNLEPTTEDAISYNACSTAEQVKASVIIAFTNSGSTALRVAKYRPRMPILALTTSPAVQRRLAISWGISAHLFPDMKHIDDLFKKGARFARDVGLAGRGDKAVITAGVPFGKTGSTNLLKVETVE
ncbi:MAG: pyruvate kinase [Chloroflexi bacterium]|nr:pyruvate kinase [Chloroflexota bacterium]